MKNQQNAWNNSQSDSQGVQIDLNLGRQLPTLLLSKTDLHGQRTGDGAWQISGSNQLAILEPESSVILRGVGTVSKSSRSRCCPGGNASEASGDLESESGVNILDGSDANSRNSKRISDQQLAVYHLDARDNVAKPNQTQTKNQPEQGFNYITLTKKDGLAKCKAGKDQRNNSNQVAGSWTFAHSQIDSSKGAK